jgi:hypothetical protein
LYTAFEILSNIISFFEKSEDAESVKVLIDNDDVEKGAAVDVDLVVEKEAFVNWFFLFWVLDKDLMIIEDEEVMVEVLFFLFDLLINDSFINEDEVVEEEELVEEIEAGEDKIVSIDGSVGHFLIWKYDILRYLKNQLNKLSKS